MSNNVINPDQTFRDSTGAVRAFGTVTFLVNNGIIKDAIYADIDLSVSQSNPYTLDAYGRIVGDVYYEGLMTLQIANEDGSDVFIRNDVESINTGLTATNNENAVIFAGPTVWQESALADLKWDDTNKRFSINVKASLESFHLQDGNMLVTPGTSAVKGELAIVGSVQDSVDLNGIQAVSVVGNYAYVACNIDDSMRIIDVTDPESPVVVGLGLKDATDFNGAYDIVCDGHYVYMSCNGDNSLRIIDVSDPETPVVVGGLKDDTNLDGIMGIYLSGSYIFACNQADNSLRIIDVSDPAAPVIVGAGLKDDTNLLGAKNVYVHGEYAYIVAEQDDSLRIIDISNILVPTIAGGLKPGASYDGPRDIVVTGKYAYMTTQFSTGKMAVIDVSDPTTPVQVGIVSSPRDGFRDLVVSGDYAYVTYFGDGASGLVVIDISDPTSPTIVTTFPGESSVGDPRGLAVSGKYAYMLERENDKFSVIKLSGAKLPTASIGSLFSTLLNVAANALIGNNLVVGGGVNVGRDLYVDGNIVGGEAVTNYVRGVVEYIEGDVGAASAVFDIDSAIAGAYESVGPTGSGATNIWTALDSVLNTAKWVKIKIWQNSTDSGGVGIAQSVFTRVTGSSTVFGNRSLASHITLNAAGTTLLTLGTSDIAIVPIDTSQRLDIGAIKDGTTTNMEAYLIGFGV